jgi:hypothetical protein
MLEMMVEFNRKKGYGELAFKNIQENDDMRSLIHLGRAVFENGFETEAMTALGLDPKTILKKVSEALK